MPQPNIVLIMTDEMRGDCMGCAGHPDVQTPYLDHLAASGTYYPNAYSSCPSCVPARAVLHTGLSPEHAGRVGYQDQVDWNYGCTMAGELSKAGYYTQCVGKMHVHPLRNYLGFHNVELHDGYLHAYRRPDTAVFNWQLQADDYFHWLRCQMGADADLIATGLDCNGWLARPWPWAEKYHPTNWVADRSIDFLRRRDPRKPFFLMTSFVRPHAPYDAPACYFDLYKDRPLRPPVKGDWDDRELLDRTGSLFNNITGPKDPEQIRRQQIGYYACISHMDNQIGRLLLALTEQGLMENTIILFTSDHGEMLSDHCLDRKCVPYQGSIRIPMLVCKPRESQPGRVDDRLVELRDIMPTLLDYAGAPIPAHLDGHSLEQPEARDYLRGEHSYGQKSNHFVVTKTDKFVWFSQTGEEQYFDLKNDPDETHNAIAEPKFRQRIDHLRQILIAELTGREEGCSDGKQLIVGCQPLSVLSGAEAENC